MLKPAALTAPAILITACLKPAATPEETLMRPPALSNEDLARMPTATTVPIQ